MATAVLIVFVSQVGLADRDTTYTAALFEQAFERMLDAEDDAASVYEELADASRWKISINSASSEVLRGLPGLSERDVQRIEGHRKTVGPFSKPADLRTAGLSEETAAALLPFVSFEVRPRTSRPRIRTDVVQRWSRRLDVGGGYAREAGAEPGYLGSPLSVQTRLNIKLGEDLSFGMTADKDAGEPFVWSPKKARFGPDFATVHAGMDRIGPFERIVIGGYTVHAGEGLIIRHGTSGLSGLRIAGVDRLFRPHASSREQGYFRGLAVQSRPVRGISLAAFAARQLLDGRRDTLEATWRLVSAGRHRTPTEQAGRRMILSRTVGTVAAFRWGAIRLGGLVVRTVHSFRSSSREASAVSFFGGWIRPRWAVAVEAVPHRAHASVTATAAPVSSAAVALRARQTEVGTYRPHTSIGVNGRGESLETKEWEAECSFEPMASWKVSVRLRERRKVDEALRMTSDRHADARLEYRPHRWLNVQLRGTARASDEPGSCVDGGKPLRCDERTVRQTARLQVQYLHSASLRSRARLEWVRSNGALDEGARGTLLYKDLRWKPDGHVQVDVRYALFEATHPSARLYVLENDVLYAFSAPSFTGRGRRWYVLARFDPVPSITVQLKFGVTVYEDVSSVGSGLDAVPGNRIREMRLQIRWNAG